MSDIRHIVFDIGRVLIHYDPELPYRRLIEDDRRRKWFLENVCTSAWNVEQDRGRSWTDAEALLIERHPEHAELIRAFRANWHEMVPHAYARSVSIMQNLIDRGHDVTMLTNFAADTFAEARTRFPFLRRPRGVTVSGEVRLIKPDRAIYELHAERFELAPTATLFIDDSPRNVDGTRAAGWRGLHFTGPEHLADNLRLLELG